VGKSGWGFDSPLKLGNTDLVILEILTFLLVSRVGDLIAHSNWVTLIG
jgi:hypothetical protein